MLRTLYLQRILSINGREALGGRRLFDHLCAASEEHLLAHAVWNDADVDRLAERRLRNDIVSLAELRALQPNVMFLEGGLFSDDRGTWRVPQDEVVRFCEAGGVFVVSDVDINELHQKKSHYDVAARVLGARARYGSADSNDPVYGADEVNCWGSPRNIICESQAMTVSEWLRPIYSSIGRILVGGPVCLGYWGDILASCNARTTGLLCLDQWIERHDCCPFASVAQIGAGFSVFVTGNVSHDRLTEAFPDNLTWLSNAVAFLVSAAQEDRRRRTSHLKSKKLLFLSHRSTDKAIVRSIAKEIKSKGVGVWFDEEQIIPSQSLTSEINSALGRMSHFVLFWSANCVGAPWVEREFNVALNMLVANRVPLLIVRLDDTEVPAIASDLLRIEAWDDAASAVASKVVDAVNRLDHQMSST